MTVLSLHRIEARFRISMPKKPLLLPVFYHIDGFGLFPNILGSNFKRGQRSDSWYSVVVIIAPAAGCLYGYRRFMLCRCSEPCDWTVTMLYQMPTKLFNCVI